ncbi:MAG: RNA ligase family protein [Thermodesulfobacteriota bacterium]|nr:RNA ligase family protein [Thermodesulfobacteriota bacterium]
MKEYHKIQTVYLRDPATKHKTLLEGQFAKPEFEYLKDNTWVFTEKVDGTNIRVQWNGEHVTFVGKTDRADTPTFLLEKLSELFPPDIFKANELPPCCLYGEGYGAKIQKGGGNYIPDGVNFILFDVKIDDMWLERHNVEDIADKLSLKIVPIIGKGTLLDGVDIVRQGYESRLRKTPPEGIVIRPEIELFNRRGERVIAKIKRKDFR